MGCTNSQVKQSEWKSINSVLAKSNKGQLLGIVDGDTIRIGIHINGNKISILMRLLGIDSVEKKHTDYHKARVSVYEYFMLNPQSFTASPGKKQTAEFIDANIEIELMLSDLSDKYGRILGDVRYRRPNTLCEHQLLVPGVVVYDGKTKLLK